MDNKSNEKTSPRDLKITIAALSYFIFSLEKEIPAIPDTLKLTKEIVKHTLESIKEDLEIFMREVKKYRTESDEPIKEI